MSNLPKKAEDRVNVFGIVLIGVASAILIWASAVALQAYYMNTAGDIETRRDAAGLDKERRSVEAAQLAMLNRLEHNDEYQKAIAACVRNPIDVAMTNVVNDAQKGSESLVPAVGPHDTPTIAPVAGYPVDAGKTAPADGPSAALEGDAITVTAPIAVGTDGKLALGSGAVVAAVAELLAQNPEVTQVEIRSYTDDRGVPEDLLERTQSRAEIVKKALVDAGVPETRLVAVGKGATEPIADNATDEGRAANNRIELIVTRRTQAPPIPDRPEPDQPEPDQPEPDQPEPDQPETP